MLSVSDYDSNDTPVCEALNEEQWKETTCKFDEKKVKNKRSLKEVSENIQAKKRIVLEKQNKLQQKKSTRLGSNRTQTYAPFLKEMM